MKYFISLFTITLFCANVWAQDKLVKDIDFDGVVDSVWLDRKSLQINCRLSSRNFNNIKSKPLEFLDDTNSGIDSAKNGFKLFNNWMRSGYTAQFRYEQKTHKIRLIGMTNYSFGNATNDGSGESSLNLLTNDYIGNWNYYDPIVMDNEGELVVVPIKSKIYLGNIYLEDYKEAVNDKYSDKSAELFERYREKIKQKRRQQGKSTF